MTQGSTVLGGLGLLKIRPGFGQQIGEAFTGLRQPMADTANQAGGAVSDADADLEALLGQVATGTADRVGDAMFAASDGGDHRSHGNQGGADAHGNQGFELKHGWSAEGMTSVNPIYRQPRRLSAASMAESLQIVHVLPDRVRLRWSPALADRAIEQLCLQLQGQPWLRGLRRRVSSRSLVLLLEPGCTVARWQAALAALGWRLEDPCSSTAQQQQQDAGPWSHLSRQLGGSMLGSALGQVVVGGGAAGLAAAWLGPPAVVAFGAVGAVVGAVLGSIVGSAIADGQAEALPHPLTQLSWRGLSTRMGEEVGSRSGVALGAALAGPAGALAGLAVGSMLGGQLAHDLTGPTSTRTGIGHTRWLVGMVRDTSGETLTQSLGSGLGARLTDGSEIGRQLGGSLGERLGKRLDWNATLHQHRLVPLRSRRPDQSNRQDG